MCTRMDPPGELILLIHTIASSQNLRGSILSKEKIERFRNPLRPSVLFCPTEMNVTGTPDAKPTVYCMSKFCTWFNIPKLNEGQQNGKDSQPRRQPVRDSECSNHHPGSVKQMRWTQADLGAVRRGIANTCISF